MGHGGDIYRNRIQEDFSVNLNPAGTPPEVLEAAGRSLARIREYPDPMQEAVRTAIAGWELVPPDYIAAGNGASGLIMASVRAVRPGKALLFEPSYSGYAHALRACGCSIRRVFLKEENGFALTHDDLQALEEKPDLVFVCDPANPSGLNLPDEVLAALLDRTEDLGIRVMLDRSFFLMSDRADRCAGENRLLLRKYRHLYILCSLTKILAAPGIRMGYVLSAPENIGEIQRQLPEWDLSVTAEEMIGAGCDVLRRTDFAAKARELILKERRFLAESLEESGLTVFESHAPYILFKGPETLFDAMLGKGILLRDCCDYPGLKKGFYRTAVKDHAANVLFAQTLREVMDEI